MVLNIKTIFFIGVLVCLTFSSKAQDHFAMARQIEKNIKAPVFKKKQYNVTKFGAKGDGKTDSRPAINKAITKASRKGGTVVLPPGMYFVKGPVILKSNVNLNISEGAELFFSSDANDYLPVVFTRWEGTELYNYSPLIYAYQQKNIGITGKGLLNGMGKRILPTGNPIRKKTSRICGKWAAKVRR